MASPDPRKANSVPSIISADLQIDGNVTSQGDIQIDGTVNGDIKTRTLTLGEKGQVRGAIRADSARVCGTVEGEVCAATIILTKTAKVRGDVLHESLAIEAGAFIDGHCRRLSGDEIKREEPQRAASSGGNISGPTPVEMGGQNKGQQSWQPSQSSQPSRTTAA